MLVVRKSRRGVLTRGRKEEREEEEKEVKGLVHEAGQRKGVDDDSLGSAGG